MKQLQIVKYGGPEVLKIIDSPSPKLESGSVRIRVQAAGVNFADLMMRMGLYPEAPKAPFTPGYEVAGEVTEVAPEVKNFKVGDRVLAGSRFGGYTTEIVLPEFQVRKVPGDLSAAEAACIPVNFMTAWVALHEMGRVRTGDRVLIQSAAGGVGVAAVQLAANAGAHVVGLVGSESKFSVVESLGAEEVWKTSDWENSDRKEMHGFDIILDATGGKSLKRSFARLATSGRVVNFGLSNAVSGSKRSLSKVASTFWNTALFTPFKLMNENKGVYGLNMLKFFEQAGDDPRHSVMAKAFDGVIGEFQKGNLKVIVGKTFSLEDGGKAHDYLQSRANIGKVVLSC